jgi:predicted membrane metal-binding protein
VPPARESTSTNIFKLGMAFAYSQVVYPNAVIDARFAVSFGLPFFLLLSYLEPFNEQRQCPFNRQSLLAPNRS